jgi:hypothetical protein
LLPRWPLSHLQWLHVLDDFEREQQKQFDSYRIFSSPEHFPPQKYDDAGVSISKSRETNNETW